MKTRLALTSFIDEVIYQVVLGHRRISDAVELPDSYYRVIRLLDKEKKVNMTHVSNFLGVSTARATKIADEMVAQKLIERISGSDRRTVGLQLTEKGTDIIQKTTKAHQQISENILADLTQEEREIMYQLLLKCRTRTENLHRS